MPRRKTTAGRPKTVSCPRCGKKFCTETNVLQHMNQPSSPCYGANFSGKSEMTSTTMSMKPKMILMTGDLPMEEDLEPHGRPAVVPEDIEMDDGAWVPPIDPAPYHPERFVEAFEGCAEAFPGGTTFMDAFWADQYADQRRENIYYPWASKQEWAFASWLLRSRLSMVAINSLLSLEIIQNASLSFRSAQELRTCAEILPPGPRWLCETLQPEGPVKKPLRLFYRNPIDCLQNLLSHPCFEPHISFVPRKVWTSAAKLCRIYDEWLTGDRAWDIQEALPPGATLLGVVLSSDKTNISVISGNRVAYPLLISLANIDASIRSKASLHAYLLLALLPVAKFCHQTSRVRGLLQDRLVHQALTLVLAPLKTAAAIGIMMSDPVGNLRYCFTPIASWIADTPEETLLAAAGSKASPVTTNMSKTFGDPYRHPSRTANGTLTAIRTLCSRIRPNDYNAFLKAIRPLGLNGVVEPVWKDWMLSDPSDFLTIEPLHHFARFAWDHDVRWCIKVLGDVELDFRFSLIQTTVGYRAFDEGISKLKQVTGRDHHRAVQRYLIGIIAGGVPRSFTVALRALADFRYLAQAPVFTTHSLDRVARALQEFHDNKGAIIRHGARDNWEIPKLELLQSVVPGIRQSGAAIQWTADVTEHAHVQEIKIPARAGNNQNYYSQISRHLDRLDKCSQFDLATCIEEHRNENAATNEDTAEEEDEDHEPDAKNPSISEYAAPSRPILNYFSVSSALLQGSDPAGPKPFRTFATQSTAFHLARKPSLQLTVAEAAAMYGLPDLIPTLSAFFEQHDGRPMPQNVKLQVWCKLRVQQRSYHDPEVLESPQTLRAIPPSNENSYGQYDCIIMNSQVTSDWPKRGLLGHSVGQLRIIFRLPRSDIFLAYIQHFTITSHANPGGVNVATGMHALKRAVRADGICIGEVIPLTFIRSPAHLQVIPQFGAEAHSRLTKSNTYELSTEFWLNKYWSKQFYYALSPDPV